MTVYMFSLGAGAGTLQGVYLGELLPREYTVLSMISVFLATLAIFIVTEMFPILLAVLSQHGTYWLSASISLSSSLFYYFLMPEMRGKTTLEIKQIFFSCQKVVNTQYIMEINLENIK